MCFIVFFFNDTATTEIYTLSLHDALPICPYGDIAVSPWKISTSSTSTPKASAAICDQDVTWPWPWGEVPVTTSTLPEASIWTLAVSQPLPPVRNPASTCEGARPQISV